MKHFSKYSVQTIFALAFIFIGQTQIFAQKIQVTIINGLTNQPLANVLVLDQNQNLLGESNSKGHVLFNAENGDVITFRLFGFEMIEQTANQIRLTNNVVKLYPAIEELEAIEVATKKRRVLIEYSQFELWENGVIAITKDKRKIIVFDEAQKPLYQMKIPVYKKDKMTELFLDADKRLYLLGKNYVIQLHVTQNKLFHFSAQSKTDFNKYIKNLKLVTKSGANIYRDLSRISYTMPVTQLKEYTFFNTDISYPKYHNCGTDFIAYQLGTEPQIVFSTIDTNAFYAADREFYKYVGLYGSKLKPFLEENEAAYDAYKRYRIGNLSYTLGNIGSLVGTGMILNGFLNRNTGLSRNARTEARSFKIDSIFIYQTLKAVELKTYIFSV